VWRLIRGKSKQQRRLFVAVDVFAWLVRSLRKRTWQARGNCGSLQR
jgi:hypothetical protein